MASCFPNDGSGRCWPLLRDFIPVKIALLFWTSALASGQGFLTQSWTKTVVSVVMMCPLDICAIGCTTALPVTKILIELIWQMLSLLVYR